VKVTFEPPKIQTWRSICGDAKISGYSGIELPILSFPLQAMFPSTALRSGAALQSFKPATEDWSGRQILPHDRITSSPLALTISWQLA